MNVNGVEVVGLLVKTQEDLHKASDFPCPACGWSLALKQSQYGYFVGCTNYPDCTFKIVISRPKMNGNPFTEIIVDECADWLKDDIEDEADTFVPRRTSTVFEKVFGGRHR